MQHSGKENCQVSHFPILSTKKKHSEVTYKSRIIRLQDGKSVPQTLVHEPFDKHAQRCKSEVQLQISTFFHYSCHHLAKFPDSLEETSTFVWPKHSHPGDYKELADDSHHLASSQDKPPQDKSCSSRWELFRLAHPPEKSHTQTLKVCLINRRGNAAINIMQGRREYQVHQAENRSGVKTPLSIPFLYNPAPLRICPLSKFSPLIIHAER